MGLPRVLLLVLVLLQAGGIFDLVRRTACEEECKRNGCDDCTPGNDSPACTCHCPSGLSTAPQAIEAVAVMPSIPEAELAFHLVERRCPSPDPQEILHVPRQRVG